MTENKVTFLQKLSFILSSSQKRRVIKLGVLLFVGMLFEMASLGAMIPALSIMLSTDITKEYPIMIPVLKFLGNPTQFQMVLWGMVSLVLVYVLKSSFLVFLSWRQSKFTSELSSELSKKLFVGYVSQPYSFHLNRNSSQLLRNIQIEINHFMSVAQATIFVTLEFSIMFGVTLMLILVEPLGALVVSAFLGVFALLFHRLTKSKLFEWGENRQYHDGQCNLHLIQGLGGVKDVKLLGREEYFIEQYNIHNLRKAKIMEKQGTLQQIPRLYLELLAVMGLSGLIILMLVQGKPLSLLLPILGIFVAGAFRMIPSVNRIMISIQGIKSAEPVVQVLYDEFKMFDREKESNPINTIHFTNEISVNNINFKYESAKGITLKAVSVSIKKGESIGFFGSSGSGKSTLVDIILGLLKANQGSVTVDGVNIWENIRSWQSQIGYVPQTIYLTDDSLLKNIAFGIDDEKVDIVAVHRAINASQLNEFINSLPDGMQTKVGERGVRLSGGQRQRIGIARALYHDPEILVLDEATSSLDNSTESAVMDAVNLLRDQKTLLIVAHRLSTLIHCDRLYHLSKGTLIREGSVENMIPGVV